MGGLLTPEATLGAGGETYGDGFLQTEALAETGEPSQGPAMELASPAVTSAFAEWEREFTSAYPEESDDERAGDKTGTGSRPPQAILADGGDRESTGGDEPEDEGVDPGDWDEEEYPRSQALTHLIEARRNTDGPDSTEDEPPRRGTDVEGGSEDDDGRT